MRHIDRWRDVYVSDDLCIEQQSERKDLRCLSAVAKQKGYATARVKGGKLEIGDKSLTYRDLYLLPEGIDMEAAKLVTIPTGVCFQSHHAYLSNMFKCLIHCDEVDWNSSEQLYWFKIAEYN